jgi:hypothetical protein
MTISDFVARLTRLQKEIGNVAQIKLGKEYGETAPVFDYFDIVVVGKDIILVPSDVWERKETAYRPSLNDFFQGE